MTDKKDRPKHDWSAPLSRTAQIRIVVIAALVIVAAFVYLAATGRSIF